MGKLHTLVYTSQVGLGATLLQVEEVARSAATHNATTGVTGVLLTDGSRFLQYIEGLEGAMVNAWSRISSASCHNNIAELAPSVGGPRRFPYWPMRWLPVEPEDLRIAMLSDWRGLPRREEVTMFQVPTGIERVNRLIDPYEGVDLPDWWDA